MDDNRLELPELFIGGSDGIHVANSRVAGECLNDI
jgi:hypothetical protein